MNNVEKNDVAERSSPLSDAFIPRLAPLAIWMRQKLTDLRQK